MANDFVTITRTLVKRGWSDIEPKVAFGLISGGIASVVLNIASAYGVKIPLEVQNEIPYIFAVLGGYLTPSVGTTIAKHDDGPSGAVESETHSGNAVSVVTASTPIQRPAAVPNETEPAGAAFMAAKGWTPEHNPEAQAMGTDTNATAILHPYGDN